MLQRLQAQLRTRPGQVWEGDSSKPSRAAVAAVLRPTGDLLFIRRSERAGDPWSGHMAFPGGRAELSDGSLRVTAERETNEEVGLDLVLHGHYLGDLDEIHTPARAGAYRLVISPFVYRLSDDPTLSPNQEVASVHWISLAQLAAGKGRSAFELEWQGQTWLMPCVELHGVRIWGLTLRMLDDILARVGGVVSAPVRLARP